MSLIVAKTLACARGRTLDDAVDAVLSGVDQSTSSMPLKTSLGTQNYPYYACDSALTDVNCYALIEDALRASGLPTDVWQKAALIVGSSSQTMARHEQETGDVAMPELGMAQQAQEFADQLNLTGPVYTINTACTSSAHALILADQMLRSEQVDCAIVVGVEQMNAYTPTGFAELGLLSQTTIQPLDAKRDGLVLGEACAVIVLVSAALAHQLPAEPSTYWTFFGGANRVDLQGTTGADVTGLAGAHCLTAGLTDAGLTWDEIKAIKLQSAGSAQNDLAEMQAFDLIGQRIAQRHRVMPPATTLKPYLGHVLGASGCAELALLLGCLEAGKIPACRGLSEFDAAMPASKLSIVRDEPMSVGMPISGSKIGPVLFNFLGFGGGQAVFAVSDQVANGTNHFKCSVLRQASVLRTLAKETLLVERAWSTATDVTQALTLHTGSKPRRQSVFSQLALLSAYELLTQQADTHYSEVGLIVLTKFGPWPSMSDLMAAFRQTKEAPSPYAFMQSQGNASGLMVAQALQLDGPLLMVSTAQANRLHLAEALLQEEKIQRVLVLSLDIEPHQLWSCWHEYQRAT